MRAVGHRFGKPTFDLAASANNTKCRRYYSKAQDSLRQDWTKLKGILWLNPEFSNIAPWAEKCCFSAARGATILMLTPASVGANWYRDYCHKKALVMALNGRITFVGQTHGYPKDCILTYFGSPKIGFAVWNWNKNILTYAS